MQRQRFRPPPMYMHPATLKGVADRSVALTKAGAATGATVTLEGGQEVRAPLVIGADGVRSRIAAQLGLRSANYAGYIAYRWGGPQAALCGAGPAAAAVSGFVAQHACACLV